MYGMDNCCQRRNKDTEGRQGLSRIRAVNKAQNCWDSNVGTMMSESECLRCYQIPVTTTLPTQKVEQYEERELTASSF